MRRDADNNNAVNKPYITEETVRHPILDNRMLKLVCLALVAILLIVAAVQNSVASHSEMYADRIIELRKAIKADEEMADIDDFVIINTGLEDCKTVEKKNIRNLTVMHFADNQKNVYPIQVQSMTYARFEESGTKYKLEGGMIREAFSHDKPEVLFNALNNMADLDVSRYLVVNYGTIVRLVDRMQFIRLNVKQDDIEEINKNQKEIQEKLKIGTIKEIKVPGSQQLNGLQAAAFAMMKGKGGDSKHDRKQTTNFTKVVGKIIANMKESNMADLMKDKDIIFEGDNNIDNDYLVQMAARLLSYKKMDRVTWPSNYVFKTYDGTRYKFANTVSENARKLHVEAFGETGYEISERVKECNAFNKNMLNRIEEIRKQREEEERIKKEEEERKRLEEEALRNAEEQAQAEAEEKAAEKSGKKKDSKKSKKDDSSSEKKKDSSKEDSKDEGKKEDSGDDSSTGKDDKPKDSGGDSSDSGGGKDESSSGDSGSGESDGGDNSGED